MAGSCGSVRAAILSRTCPSSAWAFAVKRATVVGHGCRPRNHLQLMASCYSCCRAPQIVVLCTQRAQATAAGCTSGSGCTCALAAERLPAVGVRPSCQLGCGVPMPGLHGEQQAADYSAVTWTALGATAIAGAHMSSGHGQQHAQLCCLPCNMRPQCRSGASILIVENQRLT